MSGQSSSIRLVAGAALSLCFLACSQEHKKTPPPPPRKAEPAAEKPDMTIRPDHTVRWSKVCDPKTLDALRSGRLRLGITVKAFKPPAPGPVPFVVHSVPSKDAKLGDEKPQEIDRFEITPNRPFRVADGATPQRFLIELRDYLDALKESKLELEVGFDGGSRKLQGGMAEVAFELVELK
jgi:hypothetical protein